jgi:hypothetical protein
MKACMQSAYRSVRKEQKGIQVVNGGVVNILVEELGVTLWNDLVSTISRLVADDPIADANHKNFHFRGDTLYVLAELVQDIIIIFFGRANSCLCSHRQYGFPVLARQYLEFQQDIGMGDMRMTNDVDNPMIPQVMEEARLLLRQVNPALPDRLIRRLSRRAGIIRMDNAAFNVAWKMLFDLIYHMIRPGCIESVYMAERPTSGQVKRRLASNETIRMVPPLPVFSTVWGDTLHTLVPQQIEDGALALVGSLLPHKVYGDIWLVPGVCASEGNWPEWREAQKRAIADAEACYEFEEKGEDSEKFVVEKETGEFGDCEAMCISDYESDDWSSDSDSEYSGSGSEYSYPYYDSSDESEFEDDLTSIGNLSLS